MQSTIDSQVTLNPDLNEINKGLRRLGLEFSDSQLNQLYLGNIVSLEELGLNEIGSFFILASAVAQINLGIDQVKITFKSLKKSANFCGCCSGIPVYCWYYEGLGKGCIYLTLIDGNPAISTCKKYQKKSIND